jgi:hypothetical protein
MHDFLKIIDNKWLSYKILFLLQWKKMLDPICTETVALCNDNGYVTCYQQQQQLKKTP